MDYIKLYKAADQNEAYFIKGLLEKNCIDVKLLGGNLSVAMGGLPLEVIQVDLLVLKNQFNDAKKIIKTYEAELKNSVKQKNWICKHCSKSNPKTFDLCWNCNKEFKF